MCAQLLKEYCLFLLFGMAHPSFNVCNIVIFIFTGQMEENGVIWKGIANFKVSVPDQAETIFNFVECVCI